MMNERQKGIVKMAVALLLAQIERKDCEELSVQVVFRAYDLMGVKGQKDNPLYGVTAGEVEGILKELSSQDAVAAGLSNVDRFKHVLATIDERRRMDGFYHWEVVPYVIYVPESWSMYLDEDYMDLGDGNRSVTLRRRLEQIEGVTKVLLNMHGDYIKVEKAT
jgi:hypothetical protein